MAKLLLVEDEATARLQLAQFLTEEGYSVVPVASGEEALKLLQTETFDTVITDFKLRRAVSGRDVLSVFERVSPGKGKLLVTAYPAHEVRAKSLGALSP